MKEEQDLLVLKWRFDVERADREMSAVIRKTCETFPVKKSGAMVKAVHGNIAAKFDELIDGPWAALVMSGDKIGLQHAHAELSKLAYEGRNHLLTVAAFACGDSGDAWEWAKQLAMSYQQRLDLALAVTDQGSAVSGITQDKALKLAAIDPRAAPAINRDKAAADRVAVIVRERGGTISAALREVVPEPFENRDLENIRGAVRKAFNHYYDKLGIPKI